MLGSQGMAWSIFIHLEVIFQANFFFVCFFFACLFGLILPSLCLFQYTDEEVERCYEEFYEDVHTEFLKFGEIVNFKVA